MKKALGYLLIIGISFLLWKCASQTTPTGGPKDEDSPILKRSNPTNKQTKFKGKQVELIFDEALKLNNPKEEIIINPDPGKDILFSVKQNRVYITPKIGWRDSTTYSISFREGIQDLNEGNPAEELHLAFSTGPTIDSLEIIGKVTQSLNEKIPEKITVALYQLDTFNIFKHAPPFFTKTKKDGTFKFENLQSGSYRIYAFDDKNKNLKVESKTEKFGFASDPILLNKNTDTVFIAIYQIDSRLLKINSIRNTGTITKLTFNKQIVSYKIHNPHTTVIHHAFGDTQEEINIYNQLELNDSIKLRIQGIDSLELKVDSTFYIKRIESKLPKEKFNSKILSATIDLATFEVIARVEFSKPIQHINYDSIYITPDEIPDRKAKELTIDKNKSEAKGERKRPTKAEVKKDSTIIKKVDPIIISLSSKNISIDSSKRILTIQTIIDKKIIKEKVKQLNIALEQSFIVSIEGDSSKREIKSIPITDEESAGILHIETLTKFKNYEIRLLTTNNILVEKARNVKKHTFKYLTPQEYKILYYVDLNNNGIWDCQNYYLNKEAEPTFFYKSEGKNTFPVRSTWEIGPFILKF